MVIEIALLGVGAQIVYTGDMDTRGAFTGQKETTTQSGSAPTQRTPYPTPPGIEMSEKFPGVVKPLPEKVIFSWEAASRPFKQRTRKFYSTMITIVLLLSLILFFAGQVLPIAVILAAAFLTYVLSTIPPTQVNNQITTYGIRQDKTLYYWQEMGRFWFDKKYGQPLLHIEIFRFPNRLSLLFAPDDHDELKDLLSEVLLNQKPEPTIYEKAAAWLEKNIPLDIEA